MAVWSTLRERIGQRAFAWLRFLEIAQLEQARVVLRVLPGHREVLGFCTEQRLDQIAQQLKPILGRRVRVTVQPPENQNPTEGAAASEGSTARAPTRSAADRRAAMNLPLVQRVLEHFPDATLLDARDETELPPPPTSETNDEAPEDDNA